MSFPNTAGEIIQEMPENFNADAAGDMEATIQFELTGDNGGTWAVHIEDGQCKVLDDGADSPTMTLSMDADDFVAMSRGDLNPMGAFMAGKIKVQGDMSLAMKMQSIFGLG